MAINHTHRELALKEKRKSLLDFMVALRLKKGLWHSQKCKMPAQYKLLISMYVMLQYNGLMHRLPFSVVTDAEHL